MSEFKFPRSVWVSYASQQQPIVNGLAQYFKQASPKIVVSETKEETVEASCWAISSYIRTIIDNDCIPCAIGDLSEEDKLNLPQKTRYLESGETIQNVVETIAKSLRRVVIISPQYIMSKYCLWELCSCLIYNNNNILFIMNGISGFAALSQTGESYAYSNAKTLAQALASVYEEHKDTMPIDFLLKQDSEQFFSDTIQALEWHVYESGKKDNENATFEEIYSVSIKVNLGAALGEFNKYLDVCYLEWRNKPYTKKLLGELKVQALNPLALNKYCLSLITANEMTELITSITDTYHEGDFSAKKRQQLRASIHHLAAIISMLRVEPEWLIEMRDANPMKTFLSMSIPVYVEDEFEKMFDFKLAGLLIQQVPITLTQDKFSPEIGGVKELEPLPKAMNTLPQDDKDLIIKEVVSRVMNMQGDELSNYMRPDWERRFRAHVKNIMPNGLLPTICFLFKQEKFTKKVNQNWACLVKDIIDTFYKGADLDELVNIGVLELLASGRHDIEYAEDHESKRAHVLTLMRCQ